MRDWSPRVPSDAASVRWLERRTNRRPYADNPWLQDSVGPGWDAYARVFCEPRDADRWADVAASRATTMHPLAEWPKLSRTSGLAGWNVGVEEGFLPELAWRALCNALAGHTTSPARVSCLIWLVRGRDNHPELAHLPVVDYQQTQWWLAEASLADIAGLTGWDQPDYLWPADHAWTVMSHYDFEYGLVGGARSLIDALVSSADLEALEVPADSRWGDIVN